jgi:uncharacterized protein
MGEVDTYPNGTFCWVDLGTTDVAGAKRFYGTLLGWQFQEAGEGEYTICTLDGREVAGIHAHSKEEGTGWSSAISVDDLEDTLARAEDLGGTPAVHPTEVPGTARMAVIRDPVGAKVTLWQTRGFVGARLVNEVGTWHWNELVTRDLDGAAAFYEGLFGWSADRVAAAIPRLSFGLDRFLIGGAHGPAPGEDDAPRWTVSFLVADADRAVATVERLGGRVMLPPMDLPAGRFSVVSDPAGASATVTAAARGPFRGVDGS